jgi:predicted RNA-binding Zn-ribbon protein involved in translation (DUF1610 family)
MKKKRKNIKRLSKSTSLKCPNCGSNLRRAAGSWDSKKFYFCRKCNYRKYGKY